MKRENPPKQESHKYIDYKLIEYVLNKEPDKDLPEETLKALIDDIDNQKSYTLLAEYLKKNISRRLFLVMTILNFNFVANPDNFDSYIEYRDKIKELLEEEDGIIDASKREQARLLLKVIKDARIPQYK